MKEEDNWDEPSIGYTIITKTSGFFTKVDSIIIYALFSIITGMIVFF